MMELPDDKRIVGVPPVHNHDVVSLILSNHITFQYSDDISLGFGRPSDPGLGPFGATQAGVDGCLSS